MRNKWSNVIFGKKKKNALFPVVVIENARKIWSVSISAIVTWMSSIGLPSGTWLNFYYPILPGYLK